MSASVSEETVRETLRSVVDPELGINIVDLGLVYEITVAEGRVLVKMTMTTPACPVTEFLEQAVAAKIRNLPGVKSVEIALVWSPPWTPESITPEGRRMLGLA